MRPGRFLVALLTVGLAFGLAGSANAAGDGNGLSVPSVDQLLGSEYRSISAKGNSLIRNRAVYMRFFMHSTRPDSQPQRPTLGFAAGCNALGGEYRIRKGRLFLRGQVSGTARGCPKNADRWLVNRLRKSMIIRTVGNRLILSRPAERIRFVLRTAEPQTTSPPKVLRTADSPATVDDLDGKSFESTDVIGPELGANVSLAFTTGLLPRHDDAGNQIVGPLILPYLNCNRAGGEYRIENGILHVTDLYSTSMLCLGSKEGWLFRFLSNQPEIGYSGPLLLLTKGTEQIALRQVNP